MTNERRTVYLNLPDAFNLLSFHCDHAYKRFCPFVFVFFIRYSLQMLDSLAFPLFFY